MTLEHTTGDSIEPDPTSHMSETFMRNLSAASSRFEQSRIAIRKRNTKLRLTGLAALALAGYVGYEFSKEYFARNTAINYEQLVQPNYHQTQIYQKNSFTY